MMTLVYVVLFYVAVFRVIYHQEVIEARRIKEVLKDSSWMSNGCTSQKKPWYSILNRK